MHLRQRHSSQRYDHFQIFGVGDRQKPSTDQVDGEDNEDLRNCGNWVAGQEREGEQVIVVAFDVKIEVEWAGEEAVEPE